jgi:hypothetical protein
MAMFAAKRGWKASGLGAALSVCLLFLQLAVAIGSPTRHDYGAAFSKSDSAVSICAQLDKDANRAPSPQGHPHKNCVACAFGQFASSQDGMALIAKSVAPFFRDAPISTSCGNMDIASLLAAGFASSWSSRAPPIFS